MQRNGWRLLFHKDLTEQLRRLIRARNRAQRRTGNANAKLLDALARVMLKTIPDDPSRREYRQGKTLGARYRHWCRAKIGQRFRLFFRYDSRSKVIVYVWANDQQTLRAAGSRRDPYAVFARMLERGDPPDEWDDLVNTSEEIWPGGK